MPIFISDNNSLSKHIVYIVSRVLYGNGTAALTERDHGNSLTAVTAERKQKGVQLLVIRVDLPNDIFLSLFCLSQVHISYRPLLPG